MSEQAVSEVPRGLPAPLPAGEHILWQGKPDWRSFARNVFHIRLIAAYFFILAAWNGLSILHDSGSTGAAVLAALFAICLGALALGIFYGLAWLSRRTTIYTITNRRVLLRIGVALPKTIDIPFAIIHSAALSSLPHGCGNIALRLKATGKRTPFAALWPHVRPWKLREPEPTLRSIPDAKHVAELMASAIATVAPSVDTSAQTSAEDENAPQTASSQIGRAKAPLMAAAALVLFAVVSVAAIQIAGVGASRNAGATPQEIHNLSFAKLGSDRIAVIDIGTNKTIATIEPGNDGLIRGALRGLDRTRKLRGLDADDPYQLVLWDSGRLTLSDMSADRHFPLTSFGPFSTGATAQLMKLVKGQNLSSLR